MSISLLSVCFIFAKEPNIPALRMPYFFNVGTIIFFISSNVFISTNIGKILKVYYLCFLMKFAFPEFLFALFAIAIPIIIHLFSFRRFKKVYFSNVRFLKEVKQETQSKSKLKHLLVLLSRILAITFLVFAFTQPYFPVEDKKITAGDNVVSIFIDNSFSMDAINTNGRLLDEAKRKAMEIAAVYRNTDRFQILTNDFEGKHQAFSSKEDLQELIDEIKISPATRTAKEIVSRQYELLNSSKSANRNAYIISDFQKSVYRIEEIKNDTAINVFMIPVIAQQKNNVYVDSCWFLTPVQQINLVQQLSVRVKNKSENKIENIPVKLYVNGQQKAIASFSADADARAIVNFSFTLKEQGIQHGKIELTDYPVTFDDQFFFSASVSNQIRVMAINLSEKNRGIIQKENDQDYLNSLYANDSLFRFDYFTEDKLDYASLSGYGLIVLNELNTISSGLAAELKRFVRSGGSLMIFPGGDIDFNSYKSFLSSVNANYYENLDTTDTKVDKINYESDLFKEVFESGKQAKSISNLDLPVVQSHYKINKTSRSGEEYILKLMNGNLFLGKYPFEKGKIYLSSVPLNTGYSNFPKHALFVPVMYQAAIYSQPSQKLFYTIGNDETIDVNPMETAGENIFHVKNTDNTSDIIPEYKATETGHTIYVHGQVTQAGGYNITQKDVNISGLAFNYNRKESDLNCFTEDELNELIDSRGFKNIKVVESNAKNLTESLSEINEGKKLWKFCVIFALVCLGIEVILLRFWK